MTQRKGEEQKPGAPKPEKPKKRKEPPARSWADAEAAQDEKPFKYLYRGGRTNADLINEHEEQNELGRPIALAAVLILLLTNLPYLWGAIMDVPGQVFSGFVYDFTYFDILSYLAKMRQGAEGHWFYDNPFSTEPYQPILLFIFYIALGHIARLTGLGIIAVYHIARVLSGVALLWSAHRFLRSIELRGGARVLAYVFIFTAGGFGWLLWLMGESHPVEFQQTEAFAFQSMAAYPHFALALALMLLTLGDAWAYVRSRSNTWALARIFLWVFLLAWIHPRPILTLVVTVGLAEPIHSLAFRRNQASLRGLVSVLAVMLVAALPPMAITMAQVRSDPLWTEWSTTETLTQNPLQYLLGYGLLWPLAIWGVVAAWRRREVWVSIVAAWLVAATLLPYLPIAAQGRLVIGWNVPLSIAAAYGVTAGLAAWLQRRRLQPKLIGTVVFGLCCIMALSAAVYLYLGLWRVSVVSYPGYISEGRAEALVWLREHTKQPDDVVMSAPLSGGFIPAWAGNRVVVGHWAETRNYAEKGAEAARFFSAEISDEERREMVEEYGIDYVWLSGWEQMLGEFDPAAHPENWDRVFETTGVELYRWRGPTNETADEEPEV